MTWIAFLAAVIGLVMGTAPARAQLLANDPSLAPHVDTTGWSTAETPDGGLSWATLATTREVLIEGSWFTRAVFSDEIRPYDGETVRMNGFMEPLEYDAEQSHFILMAYPRDCPFCISVGPTQLVEVITVEPVPNTYDQITIEGRFELVEDPDEGMFFRLHDARQISL